MIERLEAYMLCKGYWVKGIREYDNVLVQVKEIYENGISTTDNQFFLFKDTTGIEITPEWLIRAGFNLQADNTFIKQGFPFQIIPHNYIVVYFRGQELTAFRFVHELQHFYAGVKQRELIIDYPDNINPTTYVPEL